MGTLMTQIQQMPQIVLGLRNDTVGDSSEINA
jgi:hypothetical protein